MQAVVLNNNLLSELCGVNDQNLRLFEELLGVGVFSRGNELFLETEDESVLVLFRDFIKFLETQIEQGQKPCADYIQTLFRSLLKKDNKKIELLQTSFVEIPRTDKKVFPKSLNQAAYVKAIESKDLTFGIGPAGTGKTYLAIACALRAVLTKQKKKLILTRPVVEAGESLGFLPGALEQKINPYLRPLYDAIEYFLSFEIMQTLESSRVIEMAPLAYMRGRTLSDCFIILDEAQNTTKEQMKMFLTRIGMNSKTVVTGDVTQIDLPRKKDSGLVNAVTILEDIEDIEFVFFNKRDVIRNPLVKKIVHAYETKEEKQN